MEARYNTMSPDVVELVRMKAKKNVGLRKTADDTQNKGELVGHGYISVSGSQETRRQEV